MKIKRAIAAFPVLGVAVLGSAHVHGHPPTRTYRVKIDGERNLEWVARQPNAAALHQRLLKAL
ncbi:hypothetical protein [Bradyrhizobium sp. DOA9]|uniref:hypothetical protein n=1 Tax=Bradyrhizobium sp. DOA9 TaxID=1126627 RepID=UPI000723284F|nr:hypothetical protein [Bradyrhizobium sp. DOA9]GAJ33126.1 hypothetical protein BDOA9_0123210 [Bradyrhizobium sp. DOA9]